MTGEEGREQFNIGGAAPETLAAVLRAVRADPAIAVEAVQGREDAPTLVVVQATRERADRLKSELSGRAIVERDVPLDPL